MSATRRGEITEQIARLNVELSQEEFYANYLPERRQLALIGGVMDIGLSVIMLAVFIWMPMFGVFRIIVLPLLLLFWFIWVLCTWKRIGKDISLLVKSGFQNEMASCIRRQEKIKNEILDLENELKSIPVPKWNQ